MDSKIKDIENPTESENIGLDNGNGKPRLQYVEGPKTLTPSLIDLNENNKTDRDYDVITQTHIEKT